MSEANKEKPRVTYSGLSPMIVPFLKCADCGSDMRIETRTAPNGKVQEFIASCDAETCKRSHVIQPEYIRAQTTKYVPLPVKPGSQEKAS